MAKKLKEGDAVEWETTQGTTSGTVKKKLTKPKTIKGHTAKASKEEPQLLVESAKTGAEAAHKPESLKKKSTTSSKKKSADASTSTKKKSSDASTSAKKTPAASTTPSKPKPDDAETYKEFKEAVNMTRKQLEKWLETDESNKVGQKKDGGESVGHQSGKMIVSILGKKKAELDKEDYKHMRKVVSYVSRHSAQEPDGDTKQTRWRYSLKNWGHDPDKGK